MSEVVVREWQSRAGARSAAIVAAAGRGVPGLVALGAVLGLGAAQGGYFPTSWGWPALGFCWLGALVVVLRRSVRVSRAEVAMVGLLVVFTAWVALSALWSTSSNSILVTERDLIYPLGVSAVLLVTRSDRVPQLLAGVLGGITPVAAYALGTRLLRGSVFGGDIAGVRLSNPIGYWNGLAIFCVIGIFLAFGFVAHGRSRVGRVVAGVLPLVLVPTLYFTFSRGSWISLGIGLVVALALDPERLRLVTALLFTAPWPTAAAALAARSQALTHTNEALAVVRHDGHRLALWILLLAVGAAVSTAALVMVDARWRPQATIRRAYAAVLVLALAAGLTATFVRYGTPVALAKKGWHSFTGPPVKSPNLNSRLLNLSSNGRIDLWRVAWQEAKAHPLVGGGAGSYGAYWLQHRPAALFVRDAHSLYMQELAEVGIVGLGLLAAALLIPLAFAVRMRRERLVVPAAGAYVAFLVHQAVDWDWELPAMTLAGLLVGAAIVVTARRKRPLRLSPTVRWPVVALFVGLAAFAFVGLVGNRRLAQSADAASAKNYRLAATRAREAIDWAPWSSDAWMQLGEAQYALGKHAAAMASFRKAVAKDPSNTGPWADILAHSTGKTAAKAQRVLHELDPVDFPQS